MDQQGNNIRIPPEFRWRTTIRALLRIQQKPLIQDFTRIVYQKYHLQIPPFKILPEFCPGFNCYLEQNLLESCTKYLASKSPRVLFWNPVLKLFWILCRFHQEFRPGFTCNPDKDPPAFLSTFCLDSTWILVQCLPNILFWIYLECS